jgi:molybdate transport system substrate-binding protein
MALHLARFRSLVVMTILALGAPANSAHAGVRIYAAGAVQKAIVPLLPAMEVAAGQNVTATFDTVGALAGRIKAGNTADIVILSLGALKRLESDGLIAKGSIVTVGRTGVGLAGPLNQPAPDISTPDALKATLLAAPSIVHADPARGATAGAHFANVLAELGIAEQLKDRVTVVPFGGAIAGEIAAGKFAVGASQASEIVPNTAVRFLGFLPEPYQLWTVYALATPGVPAAETKAVIDVLTGAAGKAALAKIGFQP